MKKLLFLLLFSCCFSAHAQNYSCFTPGVRQYFVNSDTGMYSAGGYLRCMNIDSVSHVGNNTIYYPFHSIRGNYGVYLPTSPYISLDSTGGSWLGKKVTQLPDGTFLFDNYWGDTVVVKTQANVGDTWVLFKDTTNWYYTATMVSKGVMTIMGITDSIKTIKVTAYKNGIINLADPVNGLNIILSKSHGFAQVCDLYMFPMHLPGVAYNLNGMDKFDYYTDRSTNKSPDIYNLTFSQTKFYNPQMDEVNNFNIGDVFETQYYGTDPERAHFLDTIFKKGIYTDHIEYEVHEWEYKERRVMNLLEGSMSFNDITFNVDKTLFFDTSQLMPEDYRHHGFLYYYTPDDASWCYTSNLYMYESDRIVIGNSGVQVNYGEVVGGSYMFKLGFGAMPVLNGFTGSYPVNVGYSGTLGVLYYDFENDPANTNDFYSLEYVHKKGNPSCGSYVGLAVPNIKSPLENVQIYPNPTTDQLSIKLLAGYSYKIALINSIGEVLYTNANAKNTEEVNTHNIPTGIYIVLVTDEFGNSSNYKVVVQH